MKRQAIASLIVSIIFGILCLYMFFGEEKMLLSIIFFIISAISTYIFYTFQFNTTEGGGGGHEQKIPLMQLVNTGPIFGDVSLLTFLVFENLVATDLMYQWGEAAGSQNWGDMYQHTARILNDTVTSTPLFISETVKTGGNSKALRRNLRAILLTILKETNPVVDNVSNVVITNRYVLDNGFAEKRGKSKDLLDKILEKHTVNMPRLSENSAQSSKPRISRSPVKIEISTKSGFGFRADDRNIWFRDGAPESILSKGDMKAAVAKDLASQNFSNVPLMSLQNECADFEYLAKARYSKSVLLTADLALAYAATISKVHCIYFDDSTSTLYVPNDLIK